MLWSRNPLCQKIINRWRTSSIGLVLVAIISVMSTGCSTTGVALRSETVGYLAKDTKVDAFFPNDRGEPTRMNVTIPAGSMLKTSGTKFTPETEKK